MLLGESEVASDLLPGHVGDVVGVVVTAAADIPSRGHDEIRHVAVAVQLAAVQHHDPSDGVVVSVHVDALAHLVVCAAVVPVDPEDCREHGGVLTDEVFVVDPGGSAVRRAARGEAAVAVVAGELAQQLLGLRLGHATDDALGHDVTAVHGTLVVLDDASGASGERVSEQLLEQLLLGELVQVTGHRLVVGDECPGERLDDLLVQVTEDQAETELVGRAHVDDVERHRVEDHHAVQVERLLDGDRELTGDLAGLLAERRGEHRDVLRGLIDVDAVGIRDDDLVRLAQCGLHVVVGPEDLDDLGAVTFAPDQLLKQVLDGQLLERGRGLQDEPLRLLGHFFLLGLSMNMLVEGFPVKHCNLFIITQKYVRVNNRYL